MKKKRILYFLAIGVLGYFTGMLAGRAWALGTSFNLNTLVPMDFSILFIDSFH